MAAGCGQLLFFDCGLFSTNQFNNESERMNAQKFEEFSEAVGARVVELPVPTNLPAANRMQNPGSHQSAKAGDGYDILKEREYNPLDDSPSDIDISSIVFSFDDPRVIEYEANTPITVELIVQVDRRRDSISTMRVGKDTYAAELAASLLKSLESSEDLASAHIFSERWLEFTFKAQPAAGLLRPLLESLYTLGRYDDEEVRLPFQRTFREEARHIWQTILNVFRQKRRKQMSLPEAETKGESMGASGFEQVVRSLMRVERRLVIFISDFHLSDSDLAHLAELASRHVVCCAVLTEPGEYSLSPVNGCITYRCAITNRLVTVQVKPEHRDAYAKKFREYLDQKLLSLRTAGCRCAELRTDDSVDLVREKITALLLGQN
jgi:uncharacterized protein (DUF58 family)